MTDKITALYCRLSSDDGKEWRHDAAKCSPKAQHGCCTNKGEHLESNSISNQRAILLDYAEKNGFANTRIYADDGWSGTNYNRPDFQRLLDDIKSGKVGTVITKDLSRLGREHIMTGMYIEMVFPQHGVRYIAIGDHIDTERGYSETMPFLNICNERLAQETSRKVREVIDKRAREGKHLTSNPPYGYQKSPDDGNKWIIDEEAAAVKLIYRMCIAGTGPTKIAEFLTSEGVENPVTHQQKIRGWKRPCKNPTKWATRTVVDILGYREYTGCTVNCRSRKRSYKLKIVDKIPKEQWLVFEGTHEAIISKEDFELVQQIREHRIKHQKREK